MSGREGEGDGVGEQTKAAGRGAQNITTKQTGGHQVKILYTEICLDQ